MGIAFSLNENYEKCKIEGVGVRNAITTYKKYSKKLPLTITKGTTTNFFLTHLAPAEQLNSTKPPLAISWGQISGLSDHPSV